MFDAREPLFQHALILNGAPDPDRITIWSDGRPVVTIDTTGLNLLGQDLRMGDPPAWMGEHPKASWPLEIVGQILMRLVEGMEASGVAPMIKRFYGGKKFGPANPDIRTAGLKIEDDRETLTWA
jgi:hypothetical protein